MMITHKQQQVLEANVLRRLLRHLDDNKEIQNIDLMIHAGFCRNCLSKWYLDAAKENGMCLSLEETQQAIYGIPYKEWKDKYQTPASKDQINSLARKNR